MRLAAIESELAAERLTEADLRLEIENLKLAANLSDSLRQLELQLHIDSLRRTTNGEPVVADGDTLFYIYATSNGWAPRHRAEVASQAIEQLGKTIGLKPDSVYIVCTDVVTDVMYEQEVILSVSDRDALWAGCSRDSLAYRARGIIIEKLQEMKNAYGIWPFLRRTLMVVLIIVSVYFLFKLINRGFRRLNDRLERLKDTKLKPVAFHNVELLDTQKQVRLLLFLAKLLRYFVYLIVLALTVPLIFSIFPQTKALAGTILSYIWNPVHRILDSVVNYIPNLFTITIICIAIAYLVKVVRYLAHEIAAERMSINGFYPDWAMPTYYIIRFLFYAFMIAMIYPYLPGSESGIFQGISVFLGLIVSLGSSSVIGNIIAGLVITYMRPFKMGDRISLGETTGHVIEKTPLVTRIRTPKNEIITVPNSFIMSSQTVNYSQSAREFGLIIHTEVTIGYDAPWRQVHQLLIDAALNTPGVVDDPRPFVLETALNDWYPVYQLNAYVRDADNLAKIYSDLHQNIQDSFNQAGVEIMSPQYVATRDGNETTIPKGWPRSTKAPTSRDKSQSTS